MPFTNWLRTLRSLCRVGTTAPKTRRAVRSVLAKRPQLQFEVLEDRYLPSTFTVLNLLDTGPDSLRAAVAAANANPGADTIDFATTGAIALTSGQLDITDSLTINGPGAGALTVSGNDASRVLNITGSTTNVDIRDLTIAHGNGWGAIGHNGGAIYNAAVLTVSNSTLSGNTSGYGGAIYNAGALTFRNSTLSGNEGSYGGAIDNSNSGTLTVSNSTLSGNVGWYGGAIYNTGAVTVSNGTLSGNIGGESGGAIYNTGTLTVSNSTLSGNTSVNYGGAIYNQTGALTVSNSTLSGNGVHDGAYYEDAYVNIPCFGGGIFMEAGQLSLSSSTITSNFAFGSSYVYPDYASGNPTIGTDAYGGGLAIGGGTVSIDHCTIAHNSAIGGGGNYPGTGYGGGIDGSGSQLYDSILASNSADYYPDLEGSVSSLGHNLIGDSTGGSGFAASDLLNVDPRLGPLQDNGGPTQTMLLLAGSPAFNAGDDTGAPAYDQRGPGFPRVLDGAIDIGAFEAQAPLPPALVISDVWLSERNVGATAAVFTVRLSAASAETVSVRYATADGSATVSDNDYQAATGMLTFAPGETSKTITVLVNGDRRAESNETLFVNLTQPTNAAVTDGQGMGVIVDDEPRVSIGDVTRTEGNTGTTLFAFTVSLSAAYDAPVTVSFATTDGTATAGSDYQAAAGTLTIPAGQTSGTITALVNGDRLGEANETFAVNLIAPTNASVADGTGVGTIVDDEPRVSISGGYVPEGNSGTSAGVFTVRLSGPYVEPVVLSYATVDDYPTFPTAYGIATAGSDFQSTSGTLTFAPGETSKTLTVPVIGDRLGEPNEVFYVDLGGAPNAVVTDVRGGSTILDDEPRISISDVTKKEGNGKKSALFVFTVTLSAAYDQPVTMSFRTVDGTAKTSDYDYVAKAGTLTFAPGETTKTITIEVKGDNKSEADEYFYLDLFGNSSNSLFTKNRGVGMILNDD